MHQKKGENHEESKIVLFILLFGVSTAFADTIDDALGQKASPQVRMSTREMVRPA